MNDNRPPICPVCGNYTIDRSSGGSYCKCGWSIDTDGNEDYDPEDLDLHEDE